MKTAKELLVEFNMDVPSDDERTIEIYFFQRMLEILVRLEEKIARQHNTNELLTKNIETMTQVIISKNERLNKLEERLDKLQSKHEKTYCFAPEDLKIESCNRGNDGSNVAFKITHLPTGIVVEGSDRNEVLTRLGMRLENTQHSASVEMPFHL